MSDDRKCPTPECTISKETHAYFCWRHWYKLPQAMRNALLASSRDALERGRAMGEALKFYSTKENR